MNTLMLEDGQEISVGEVWHVRLPAATALSTMIVVDLTLRTVQLRQYPHSFLAPRFEVGSVKFFDKVVGQ